MPGQNDYTKIFTEIIKKQMIVLGPDITLARVKNVPGLVVDQSGEVKSITGDPKQLLQALINQFVELSGLIVKKTMESVLTSYPELAGDALGSSLGSGFGAPQEPVVSPQPTQPTQPVQNGNQPVTNNQTGGQ